MTQTPRSCFSVVWRDARSLRRSVANEFVTTRGVEVFVSDTGTLSVGRPGVYGDRPGFYAACLTAGRSSKSARRYFIQQARACGRVPLPR